MLATKMVAIAVRIFRSVTLGLMVGVLPHPQPTAARVNQPGPTSAHAPVHAVPPHHRAHARKEGRTDVSHARPSKAKHIAARTVQPASHEASRPLIVIDPGHGGRDPGAIGVSGTPEKTVTLATALELRRSLEATGRYRIALTRSGDQSLSPGDRLAFARKHRADLLIAIHADAPHDRSARGASVYVSSGNATMHLPTSRGNSSRIARALSKPEPQPEAGSAFLQFSMIEQLADDVRMATTPARTAHLYVLGSRAMPSALLEMGFMSNRQDESLLRQSAHRRVIVRAIRDAIDDYFAEIRKVASRT